MRPLRLALPAAVLVALAALVPSASAAQALPVDPAQALPVGVRIYDDDGYLAVGAGFTGCCDLPWFVAGVRVTQGDGSADVRVFACYTAFVGFCLVDETVQLPIG